ncbi:LacI family DNA-binding transcriptional regulator, partial [Stenotrophomonas maltophilia]|uniref:LacI family DNA-binding transcriptional regulator n=1 Tax=Stenotrophomonas maltophilia TaxID=40324 RepID=UPI00225C02D7|nr:LacI family DNA-binding transcriptional regulator [Stenotrophomonas maltophilia]
MSLKAIAKQLGISVTTVSRALNGYDDVSQETRALSLIHLSEPTRIRTISSAAFCIDKNTSHPPALPFPFSSVSF